MSYNDFIHIALAFCDPKGTYTRHAAVTLASIFEHTKSPVCVHILHDDTLTDVNRKALLELAGSYSQKLKFYDVSSLFAEKKLDVSKLTIDGMKGTLFRLFMPDVLDVDKVIYLDCDIVVMLDISELWNVQMGDKAIAAVRDVWALDYHDGKPVPWRLGKVWDLFGVAHDAYFNAGVLLMNLEKIRRKYDFFKSVESFYAQFRKCITLADQDCLNWLFANDKLLIDEKFNHIRVNNITADGVDGSIWHMAGGSAKPWTIYTRPFVDDLYWKYLCKTPFCRSEDELIHTMLFDLSHSPCVHLHSGQCAKRVWRQLCDNIFSGHIWTVPHIFFKLLFSRKEAR